MALSVQSLKDFQIEGLNSNLDALERILSHKTFIANDCNTNFLAENPEILNLPASMVQQGGKKPAKKKKVL